MLFRPWKSIPVLRIRLYRSIAGEEGEEWKRLARKCRESSDLERDKNGEQKEESWREVSETRNTEPVTPRGEREGVQPHCTQPKETEREGG